VETFIQSHFLYVPRKDGVAIWLPDRWQYKVLQMACRRWCVEVYVQYVLT
jgi:hypothetical protein